MVAVAQQSSSQNVRVKRRADTDDRRQRNRNHVARQQQKQSPAKRVDGSPSTIDEDFSQRYRYPFGNPDEKLEAANDNQTFSDSTWYDQEAQQKGAAQSLGGFFTARINNPANIVTRRRETLLIIEICTYLYIAQFLFWLISISGIAIELTAFSLGSVAGEVVGEGAAAVVAEFIPGQSIAMFGIIMAALLGWAQLVTAAVVYRVNPFGGNLSSSFFAMAAWYWIPFVGGIAPWVGVVMIDVINHDSQT